MSRISVGRALTGHTVSYEYSQDAKFTAIFISIYSSYNIKQFLLNCGQSCHYRDAIYYMYRSKERMVTMWLVCHHYAYLCSRKTSLINQIPECNRQHYQSEVSVQNKTYRQLISYNLVN